jgi:hypothetical protein
MILITALLLWTFVFNVLNVLQGLIPAAMLFSSFIYAFACFSVAVFFLRVPQSAVVILAKAWRASLRKLSRRGARRDSELHVTVQTDCQAEARS